MRSGLVTAFIPAVRATAAAVSADGTRLAIAPGRTGDLQILRADGTVRTTLPHTAGLHLGPNAWSSDDQWIAAVVP